MRPIAISTFFTTPHPAAAQESALAYGCLSQGQAYVRMAKGPAEDRTRVSQGHAYPCETINLKYISQSEQSVHLGSSDSAGLTALVRKSRQLLGGRRQAAVSGLGARHAQAPSSASVNLRGSEKCLATDTMRVGAGYRRLTQDSSTCSRTFPRRPQRSVAAGQSRLSVRRQSYSRAAQR
jgi:hypothetical protein